MRIMENIASPKKRTYAHLNVVRFVPPASLVKYIAEHERSKSTLSRAIGVTMPFLGAILKGWRQCPPAKCNALVAATMGAVTKQELRPNDWQKYWPDA
jgi:hypothetical protein